MQTTETFTTEQKIIFTSDSGSFIRSYLTRTLNQKIDVDYIFKGRDYVIVDMPISHQIIVTYSNGSIIENITLNIDTVDKNIYKDNKNIINYIIPSTAKPNINLTVNKITYAKYLPDSYVFVTPTIASTNSEASNYRKSSNNILAIYNSPEIGADINKIINGNLNNPFNLLYKFPNAMKKLKELINKSINWNNIYSNFGYYNYQVKYIRLNTYNNQFTEVYTFINPTSKSSGDYFKPKTENLFNFTKFSNGIAPSIKVIKGVSKSSIVVSTPTGT